MAGVQKPHWIAACSVNARCRSSRSPPSCASPSTVSTAWPFACTASIRHERTLWPSNRTLQFPQKPCSHARCVPFRPRSSRRKSARVRRGSTTPSRHRPLTSSRTGSDALMRSPVPCRRLRAPRGGPGREKRSAGIQRASTSSSGSKPSPIPSSEGNIAVTSTNQGARATPTSTTTAEAHFPASSRSTTAAAAAWA